jgi:hypothetical protein
MSRSQMQMHLGVLTLKRAEVHYGVRYELMSLLPFHVVTFFNFLI